MRPPVRSVVALNPWVYPSDAADLTGRRVLIVHGTDDRIADPRRAMTVARTLSQTALSLGFVSVEGGKHAMLRRGRVFERAAADFVVATVGGQSVDGPVGQVLAGEDHVSVDTGRRIPEEPCPDGRSLHRVRGTLLAFEFLLSPDRVLKAATESRELDAGFRVVGRLHVT